MAIIIEQEKKSVNWVAFATGTIIVVAIFAGAYFLFFKRPDIVEVALPDNLKNVSAISQLKFDPQPVVEKLTSTFTVNPQINLPQAMPGRQNPFRPF